MSVFLIGYDLHEGQDYEDLITAIKDTGSWWHCLDSTWLVTSEKTAEEIRDNLLRHIKGDDDLLVLLYGGSAAWYGFENRCQTWLVENL